MNKKFCVRVPYFDTYRSYGITLYTTPEFCFEQFKNRREAEKYAVKLENLFRKAFQFLETQFVYLSCVYNRYPQYYQLNNSFTAISDARAFCVQTKEDYAKNHIWRLNKYLYSMVDFLVLFNKYEKDTSEFLFEVLISFHNHFQTIVKNSRLLSVKGELDLFSWGER